jgi:HAE1 family hydrophobic/amphiphilic exporter-1
MIGVTLFGLLFTPAFYVITRNLGDRASERLKGFRTAPEVGEPA